MTAAVLAPPGSAAAPPVNKWLVSVSIAFGSLMATIDASIVNVALPNIRGELGASIQEITWISTAYMVAMVLVMPLTGFLGGFFGQKRVYLFSMCAVHHRLGAVRHRALAAGARVLPRAAGARRRCAAADAAGDPAPHLPTARAGRRDGDVRDGGDDRPAIGPVLGGYITDNYSWPWIFYINLPVGIVGMMMTTQNVREPDDVRAANRVRAEVARKTSTSPASC